MGILESYLNDFKQPSLTKSERNSFSNIMFKYIVTSCFKKMSCRAFHWASCNMIQNLTSLDWGSVPNFQAVAIKIDRKLSDLLRMKTDPISNSDSKTFGEYLMAFNPSQTLYDLDSLNNFLTQALGPLGSTTYVFDSNIAVTFHTLLLSSLYFYLCSMKQLKLYILKGQDQKICHYIGLFCNAVRIFFHVSHSNAMRAFFTSVRLPVEYPTSKNSSYYKNKIDATIRAMLLKLGWTEREMGVEDSNDGDKEDSNDRDKEENYMEEFMDPDTTLVYRRALMSFVDHYAGLRILERRSMALPADEKIKLSLIAIKHPSLYYRPWEEMECVIIEACPDSGLSNSLKFWRIIAKIKELVLGITSSTDNVILAFKTLLQLDSKLVKTQSKYPPLNASIHCESSLAAILCQLHENWISSPDASLLELFQASPFSYSSSLPDL